MPNENVINMTFEELKAYNDELTEMAKDLRWPELPSVVEAVTKKIDELNRIKVCVDACAGITNEALEKGVVKGCISIAKARVPKIEGQPDKWMGVKVWEKEACPHCYGRGWKKPYEPCPVCGGSGEVEAHD